MIGKLTARDAVIFSIAAALGAVVGTLALGVLKLYLPKSDLTNPLLVLLAAG